MTEQTKTTRPANCGSGHCSCIECPFPTAPDHVPVVGKTMAAQVSGDHINDAIEMAADTQPVARQITYTSVDSTSRTIVYGHNTIGDYRQIDPAAVSTPLYAAPVVPAPEVQLSKLTDQQMDTIYRAVWTTVPHSKRLFEFGRRVLALAAAPTTPKNAP